MRPQPIQLKLSDIENNLANGTYVIPAFQRDFVWDIEQSARLLDSWIKGYPLGSFILWTTDERLCPVKKIGNTVVFDIQDPTEKTTYILDGQQRITSLFLAIRGLQIKNKNYEDIIINLDADLDNHETRIVTIKSDDIKFKYISFAKLLNEGLGYLAKNYPDYLEKIDALRNKIRELDFSAIKIEGASIEVATEIFTRLNTGGKKLGAFDIMVAKTYKPGTFDLVEKAKECYDNIPPNYQKVIDNKFILKVNALCLKGSVAEKSQLSISRDEMISQFDAVSDAIKAAINFCITSLNVPVGNMIAYSAILELYVYFFYKYTKFNNLKSPSNSQQKNLIDYYWRSVVSERFARSTDTITETDAKEVMDKILADEDPNRIPLVLSVDALIANGEFSLQRAIIKGLIGLLMSKKPRSLSNNSLVSFDVKWVVKSQKNNYHHFFPQNMIDNTWTNEPVNNICNIILQDASTNQIDISNRRPSDYIDEFSKNNSSLSSTLMDHLIFDINDYGIPNDDFDTFIKKRASAFIEEIKTRLVPIGTDLIDSTIK